MVKVIKRTDGKTVAPSSKKKKAKKKRSIESTIQDWITERRENEDSGNRTRSAQLADWNAEAAPTKAA
jgi:hypothetical protein